MDNGLELIEKMRENSRPVREEFEKLQKAYGNEFVAIENGKVIDHDRDMRSLANRLKSDNRDITLILIQFVPEMGTEILY
jgi:hypothetical protein